ncbi:MAG: hypothetical protein ACYC6W_10890 [Nitrosotalea sp.]
MENKFKNIIKSEDDLTLKEKDHLFSGIVKFGLLSNNKCIKIEELIDRHNYDFFNQEQMLEIINHLKFLYDKMDKS